MVESIRVNELIIRAYRKKVLCQSLKKAVRELESRISPTLLAGNDLEGRKFLKNILEANGYCAVESDRLPFGVVAIHPNNPNVIRFFVVRVFRDRTPMHPDEKTVRNLRQLSLYASGFIRGAMKSKSRMSSTIHWLIIITRENRIVKVEDIISTWEVKHG